MKFSWQHGIGIDLVIILGGILKECNENTADNKIKKVSEGPYPYYQNIDRKLIDINSSGDTFFISSTGNRIPKSILNELIQDIINDTIDQKEVERRCLKLPRYLIDGSDFRNSIETELSFIAGRLTEKKRFQ